MNADHLGDDLEDAERPPQGVGRGHEPQRRLRVRALVVRRLRLRLPRPPHVRPRSPPPRTLPRGSELTHADSLCRSACDGCPRPHPYQMAEPPLEPCSGSACLCSPPRLLCACAQERVLKLLERGRLLNAHHGHRPRPHHAVRPTSGPPRVARPGTLVMAAARAAHPTEVASLLSSHAHMLSLMRMCAVPWAAAMTTSPSPSPPCA